MAKTNAMICPQCKIETNYHAEKIDYMAALVEPDAADPAFGGILEEIHTCPRCGGIETRRATAD